MERQSTQRGRGTRSRATKWETRYTCPHVILNKGQHPSIQIFLELMSRYHISVDQILFGNTEGGKSTAYRQLDALVNELTDKEIQILIATAQAILDTRADGEE